MMSAQKKYVPPNRRSNQKKNMNNTRNGHTLDTKNVSEFPALGSGGGSKQYGAHPQDMNYASVTREDENEHTETQTNNVAPGWVNLRRDATSKGGVHVEYGDTDPIKDVANEETNWGLTTSQSEELSRMVNRWQSDRDLMNDYLDQSSPYWGMKHVDDPLSEDDLESEIGSDFSDGDEHSDDFVDAMDLVDGGY